MTCKKCGSYVPSDKKYCGKCGNYAGDNNLQSITPYISNSGNVLNNNNNKTDTWTWILVIIGIQFIIWIIVVDVINESSKSDYYYSYDSYTNYENEQEEYYPTIDDNQTTTYPKYKNPIRNSTIIEYDHYYANSDISNENDARNLIRQDSISQKDNCPEEMRKIEEEYINEFGITAVNLCEMDLTFAREQKVVIRKMLNDYPEIKGYLTNLTIRKSNGDDSWAWTSGAQNFSDSNVNGKKYWIKKSIIKLSDRVYLHPDIFQTEINTSIKSGYHPQNGTVYSTMAHELGHLISFITCMKHYNVKSVLLLDENTRYNEMLNEYNSYRYSLDMLTEAYNSYKRDTGSSIDFNLWRKTISEYAVSKDNEGNYQYDETIAEAFEDVYLNEYNAKEASRYIVNVVKNKLKG